MNKAEIEPFVSLEPSEAMHAAIREAVRKTRKTKRDGRANQ